MITPFTFVHAADLHLGTPFSGIGGVSEDASRALRDATLGAFGNLVDLCIAEDAAFLVIAGDVYDGPKRSIRVLDAFIRGVRRLGAHSIPVFVATGNHDPLLSEAWADAGDLPDNLFLFPRRPASHAVLRGGERIATVHGVGYHGREAKADLAAGIRRAGEGGFEVGVAHATVGSPGNHEVYAPTTMEALKATGLDYWALGHVHTRAILREAEPLVCYPGNPQSLSPRETGPRGAFLVRVDESGRATPEFREVDLVRFAGVTVDISNLSSLSAAPEVLVEGCREALEGAGGRALLLDLTLRGRTRLFRDLSDPAQLRELAENVREEVEGSNPPLWLNRIENGTSPELDIERLAASSTLEADLIRLADELIANSNDLSQLAESALSPLYSRPGMRRLLGPLPEGEALREELKAARDLALDLLAGVEQ